MQLEFVSCNACGARLSISGAARFVDCRYCKSSLRVVRSDSALSTELHERLESVEGDVATLQGEAALQALETRWAAERLSFMQRGVTVDGKQLRQQGTYLLLICVGFGAVMLLFGVCFYSSRSGPMPILLGAFTALAGIVASRKLFASADKYLAAETKYLAARAKLLAERPADAKRHAA